MPTIPRRRRSTTLSERLTPCEACGYVLSQRHHPLPAARYGENDNTAYLCANCHEAYQVLEQGWIDIQAGRRNTHARRLYDALWQAYGGRGNPVFDTLCALVHDAEALRNRSFGVLSYFDLVMAYFAEINSLRRGDTVQLMDGTVARVVGVEGDTIHTTKGTYESWRIVKVETTPKA